MYCSPSTDRSDLSYLILTNHVQTISRHKCLSTINQLTSYTTKRLFKTFKTIALDKLFGLNFKDDSPTFVCHQSSLVCLSSFVKILRFPLFTINFQIVNFAIRIENLIVLFKYSMKPFHRRMANLSGIDPTENGSKSAVREHLWLKYRTLQKLL